jgi:hypothetical protein
MGEPASNFPDGHPVKRRKAPCPLTLAQKARFVEALGAEDVPALQAELGLLERRVALWRAFTGRAEDLARDVRAGVDIFTRDPQAGRRVVREALKAISERVLALRQAADREARPDRGDPALRSRDPRVRDAARRRIWGR